ncbi:transposase [bacterium]|nr:transposase [bacterium]
MLLTLPERKRLRKPVYDYGTPGPYYVTVCTFERELFFENEMNREIVNSVWESLPEHHEVKLDGFVIMPEHIHLILWIYNSGIKKGESKHPYFNGGRILQTTPSPHTVWMHPSPTHETENNVGTATKRKNHVPYGRVGMHADRTHQQQSMNQHQISLPIKSPNLSIVIQNFKAQITRDIRKSGEYSFAWQRSFYNSIVRNNYELNLFREYITKNPEILKEELKEE